MVETMNSARLREWARKDLARYKQAQQDIRHYISDIEILRARAERIGSAFSKDKVQVQQRPDGGEDALILIADMQLDCRRMQTDAERVCMEIAERIGQLESPLFQRILRSYWLFGQSMEQLAVSESYSYRGIKTNHARALLAYGEKFAPDCP